MKKWIALLLCMLMTVAVLPAAIAEETDPAEPAADELPAAADPVDDETLEEDPDAFNGPVEEYPEADLKINSSNFPDANFCAWVKANLAGGKDVMTSEQVKAVKVIDCSFENIASLTGISKFSNLEQLFCNDNLLTDLPLNNNKKLIEVDCRNNKLKEIHISGCKQLIDLNCSSNEMPSLNVSYNTKIQYLDCSNNKITTLNLNNITTLITLNAENNQITGMKLIANSKGLTYLNVKKNPITTLDLTALTELVALDCSNTKLKTLDLTKNTKLEDLYAEYIGLTALDVTNNTKLQHLALNGNKLTSLNLTKNTDLVRLYASDNSLKTVDVTKNTKLTVIVMEDCGLESIDLTKNTALATLNLNANELSSLNVSKCAKLQRLYVFRNNLTALDVTKLTKLIELECGDNRIGALEVNKCTALERLDCGTNQLTYLDVTSNPKLKYLFCTSNRLESLNLSGNLNLETLNCDYNRLRVLHLENNTKLNNPGISPQKTVYPITLTLSGGKYQFKMTDLFETSGEKKYVKAYDSTYSYNSSTGMMTMPGNVTSFDYKFTTGKGDMVVHVDSVYSGDYDVSFLSGEVEYKGTTPYVVYNGAAQKPAFVVRGKDGKGISEQFYESWYTDNVKPGTARLRVRMFGNTEIKLLWFKIYLPGPTSTSVANVKDGIQVKWAAVEGAAGYVIYRRAWSSTTNGWTSFERWNNTTETTWTDTKVYAGSRYQYGIKAYFSPRTDSETGATIGGAMDNYNLGLVGPLKTTVRITTRNLKSVTGGAKQITANWEGSSVFTGYEVQIATDSGFTKDVKTVKITNKKTYSTTIKSLKAATTYYVRVRSYHEFEGTTYYGQWSNVKNAKTN